MPIVGMYETVAETIYDSEPMGAGEILSLFSIPLGSTSPASQQRKTNRDTNMWMACMLPSPCTFLVTGIRCVFLNPQGDVMPVSDAIYWDTALRFDVMHKSYWESPVATVVDPIFLTTPEQWEKFSFARKRTLMTQLGQHLDGCEIQPDKIMRWGFPETKGIEGSPKIDGVMIEQQMPFHVQISHNGKWPDCRIVCALDGRMARPIL